MYGLVTTTHNLQSALSAASATNILVEPDEMVRPHHPITCGETLSFDEDGTFACPHATAPPGDRRTQTVLDASAAMLIVECMYAFSRQDMQNLRLRIADRMLRHSPR